MTCFNYKNGPAPNHFSKEDIKQYFSSLFNILSIEEEVFIDDASQTKFKIQYFYILLMEKK